MYNGLIRDFETLKRDLAFAVDPALFRSIQGSTDTEMLFFLALIFGLAADPLAPSRARSGWSKRPLNVTGLRTPFR